LATRGFTQRIAVVLHGVVDEIRVNLVPETLEWNLFTGIVAHQLIQECRLFGRDNAMPNAILG
jgi:hypothetical protein